MPVNSLYPYMRFLIDLAPWLGFAVAFWVTKDIYTATLVLIPVTVLQVVMMWLVYRRFEKLHLITLVAVIVFGGATLLLNESRFIQWKPTVVNLLFALVFFGSIVYSRNNPLPKRLLGDKLKVPDAVWLTLTWLWIGFFIFSGTINLAVAYLYSEEIWVNFKLFGQLGITLVFVLVQTLYIAKHLPKQGSS